MNAFNWRTGPSVFVGTLPPRKPDLEPKRLHIYAEATVSDKARESLIAQTNAEVERHFQLAQTVTDDVMRGYHRDEARRLAKKVAALILGRSHSFVAKLEQERGLS